LGYYGTNSFSTNLISHVVDAFGRTNSFSYDTNGNLTQITDVAGMASSMTYDTDGVVNSLTTPYGTTSFDITEDVATNVVALYRSILVTPPDGGKKPLHVPEEHLWASCFLCH